MAAHIRRRQPTGAIRDLQKSLALLTTPAPPEAVIRWRAETVLAHVRGVHVAVLIANNRARYVDANAAAAKLTGYSHAELLQMSLWDLTPGASQTVGIRLWRQFLKRGHMSGRYRLQRKDGTMVMARYHAAANVLPGVHLSALVPVTTARSPRRRRRKRSVTVRRK